MSHTRFVLPAVNGRRGWPNGAHLAAYREQAVEVAHAPKGAFELGNFGTLTRQVAADRTVNALPSTANNSKPPKAPGRPGSSSFSARPLSGRPFSNPAKFAIRPRSPAARGSTGLGWPK